MDRKNLKIPQVGVGVFVFNEKNEFLVAQRRNSHGAGEWSLPGGHLEFNENFEECCKREVMEEVGVEIDTIQFVTAFNNLFLKEELHYVTLFFGSCLKSGIPQNLEPEKQSEWKWVTFETLPSPAFDGLRHAIEEMLNR